MVSFVIYSLVVLFGSSSWLSVNSVWMELSLFTQFLPEGWSLPSYLSTIVQLAFIGPIVYSIVHKWKDVSKAPIIIALLVFCSISQLMLAFFWQETAFLFGAKRSIALLILTFFVSLVNATSNLLFMPYMSTFHPNYLSAYFVGMSLSAVIPSLLSLSQGFCIIL